MKKDSSLSKQIHTTSNTNNFNPKNTILFVSICAFCLALLKLAFGILSNSIVILASSLDSLFDTLFSLFNYYSLKKSENPPNKYFNYGFGKIEGFASFVEGMIIFISGIYIIYQAIVKIYQNKGVDDINQGIIIMLISICVTSLIITYLKKVLQYTKSLIIKAEILHYKVDLLSNFAIIISLIVISFTGLEILDGIIGILLGIYICFNAFKIIKNGFLMLLDRAIDDNLEQQILAILNINKQITSYHDVKSRISGNVIFLEYHLVFNKTISLLKAHKISDNIEVDIKSLSSNYQWVILTHLDPYDDS